MSRLRTLLLMVIGVCAISTSGPLMATMVVPPLAIAFWRNGFAAALLAPGFARRRSEITAAPRSTWRLIVISGVALAVHFGTWVTALTLTSVASATALVCLQLAWVVAWQVIGGQRFGAGAILGLVLALAGVLIVSGVDLSISGRALVGDLLSLIGGIAGAFYTMAGSRARQTVSTTTYTFVVYGTCAVLLAVACLTSGQSLGGYSARAWGLLVLVTVTAQLLGHSVFNHLLATTAPVVVSLALLLEVPGAALLAAPLLGQVPSLPAVAGLAVILAGIALVVVGTPSREPIREPVP